jgi:dCTP deaminase
LSLSDQASSSQLAKTSYVPFGKEYILHPQSFVLGVTVEWLRLPSDVAGYVVGKSSWGRCGLIIATATGVHPGFKGCLTLELSNVGEIPIEMKPGMEICQLFIHRVDAADSKAIDRSKFNGFRRPLFRRIELDAFAKKLAENSAGIRPPSRTP